jgi:hypothetical protein
MKEGSKMGRKRFLAVSTILSLVLAAAFAAGAAAVGRFLKIEGQVDLLKAGKLPGAAAKLTDPLEAKDVIRTKSRSRAQVLFIDDTVLTLAPESRVAVADYFYDRAKSQRRALIQVYRGLVHTVVVKVLRMQDPDFIMQTHTAIIGSRGTEWYTLLFPNSTIIFNIQGLLELSSSNRQIPGAILLPAMKYCEVRRDQAPGPLLDITPAILAMVGKMMLTGVTDLPLDLPGVRCTLPELKRLGPPEELLSPYTPPLTPVYPPGPGPVQPPKPPGKYY